MPSSQNRTAILLAGGLALIAAAAITRSVVSARRQAAIARAAPPSGPAPIDQAAAEKELAALYTASTADPTNRQKQWDLVNFYLKYHILNTAAAHLAIIIKLDPSDLQARLKLADVSLDARAYPAAERYYRQVIRQDARSIPARQGLCALYIQEGRFTEAMQAAQLALTLDANDPRSRLLRADVLVSSAFQSPDPMAHSADLETARRELASLAAQAPANGEALYLYGWALVGLQRREEAVDPLEKAVNLLPNNAEAARTLAMTYRSLNRMDLALKVAGDLDARVPDDPQTESLLGLLLMESSQPNSLQRALAAFTKAASAAPNDPRILEQLGDTDEKLNDMQGAKHAFEQVTKLNPARSYAYHRLSVIYTRLGESKLARAAADSAVRKETEEQELRTLQERSASRPKDAELHLELANRLRMLKMTSQARDEYLAVLRLDPGNRQVPAEYKR